MFQHGVIAQAVNQVVAGSVSYFSSAGNNGHNGYETAFNSSGITQTINGRFQTFHDFDSTAGGVQTNAAFTVPVGRTATVVLEWNQPAASVSPAHGSANDLDLFITNAANTTIVGLSQDNNLGHDPIEIVQFQNTGGVAASFSCSRVCIPMPRRPT
jgi:hypothetical protein